MTCGFLSHLPSVSRPRESSRPTRPCGGTSNARATRCTGPAALTAGRRSQHLCRGPAICATAQAAWPDLAAFPGPARCATSRSGTPTPSARSCTSPAASRTLTRPGAADRRPVRRSCHRSRDRAVGAARCSHPGAGRTRGSARRRVPSGRGGSPAGSGSTSLHPIGNAALARWLRTSRRTSERWRPPLTRGKPPISVLRMGVTGRANAVAPTPRRRSTRPTTGQHQIGQSVALAIASGSDRSVLDVHHQTGVVGHAAGRCGDLVRAGRGLGGDGRGAGCGEGRLEDSLEAVSTVAESTCRSAFERSS